MAAERAMAASPVTRPRAVGTARRPATAHRRRPGPRAARPAPLRLVADGGRLVADDRRLVPQASGQRAGVRHQPVRTEVTLWRVPEQQVPGRRVCEQPAPARTSQRIPGRALERTPARTPVRLTRRGRLVVTAAAVVAIGALSMGLSGAAQATGHAGGPAGPGQGVTKVEVRDGQSLWSIAEAYDPVADPRLVIQDILQLNSLTSDQVQPGQVLWVPRG